MIACVATNDPEPNHDRPADEPNTCTAPNCFGQIDVRKSTLRGGDDDFDGVPLCRFCRGSYLLGGETL